jgi:hypothetical protein
VAAGFSSEGDGKRVSASADLKYSFEVSSPELTPASVEVRASISSETSPGFGASAALKITGPADSINGDSSSYEVDESEVIDTLLLLLPGVVYTVDLSALANGGCFASCEPASGSAAIDPSFVPPVGDDILLSANLAPAAPEPSTWALMMLGFAGLGFAGYRARLKNEGLAG